MEVRCDKCQARYRVDDARIGPQGLTMRCGKCQNTFKVTRAPAEVAPTIPEQAPVPARPPPKPAARPAGGEVGTTMVFGQSSAAKAPAAAARPGPAPTAAAKPVSKPAAPEEGAGRTMMFQTGNLKTAPVPKKPEPEARATLAFGQPPVPAPKPAAPAAKPRPESESGSTMVFGQAPIPLPKTPAAAPAPAMKAPPGAAAKPAFAPSKPAAPQPAPVPEPTPEPEPAAPEPPAEAEAAAPAEPEGEAPTAEEAPAPEAEGGEEPSGVEAEGAEPAPQAGAFDKAPPKGLLIGVAAGLALLVLAGGGLVTWKKLAKHPPPPAAVETLNAAQADADKDTLASIASAEGKAKDALDVAGPKSRFPEATAALASIEIQWADALNDQAFAIAAKDEAKAGELQAQAKTKLKAAFDTVAQAFKADDKNKTSPELQLALADYYRAQRANPNMNKALKAAQALKADDARIALVQGLAAAQDEDGAEKAVPRLKAALAASPQSARIHYRLAMVYTSMKDEANTRSELQQTLKLSPQHERAKQALEQMGTQSVAEQK